MPRLITKFKYLKPNRKLSAGCYAAYIATREGVEKIDESQRLLPATERQTSLIRRLIRDFPDSKKAFEYEDYLKRKTAGCASDFISRTIEDHADRCVNVKTYADYIATRPRAERFGSHGLFTDDGVPVQLSKVSEELNHYEGNIWTAIISLRREDAERLGYDHGARWRDMLRTQTQAFSEAFHIPLQNLKWFAAFHNESYHPHVHLIIYSREPTDGFLSRAGVEQLRSSLAKDIFAQDLHSVYVAQTEQRDDLRVQSKARITEIVSQINCGVYENKTVEDLLLQLAERLSNTSGKMVYGYLKADVKSLVDAIVDELASDDRITRLYDLWYEQREAVLKTYTDTMPERVPLVANKEFKFIKNAVIQEALNLNLYHITEEDGKRVPDAIRLLELAAENGSDYAEYLLGRLYLSGQEVEQNVSLALRWLEGASDHRNQSAKQILHSYHAGRVWSCSLGALHLLQQLARAFENRQQEQNRNIRQMKAERKLLQKIEEKRQAHGLKHG